MSDKSKTELTPQERLEQARAKYNKHVQKTGADTSLNQKYVSGLGGSAVSEAQRDAYREVNPDEQFDAQEAGNMLVPEDVRRQQEKLADLKKKSSESLERMKKLQPNSQLEVDLKDVYKDDPKKYEKLKKLNEERTSLLMDSNKSAFDAASDAADNLPTAGSSMLSGVMNTISSFIPDSWGLNEEQDKKLEKVNDEIHAIQTPGVKIALERDKNKLAQLQEAYKQYEDDEFTLGVNMDKARLEAAMMKTKRIIKSNEDYLNKAGGWQSVVNGSIELGTLGMLSTVEDVVLTLPTLIKAENKEELTDNEKLLLESATREQEHLNSSAGYSRKYWYGMMEGVMHSATFMGEMATTGAAGKLLKVGGKAGKTIAGKVLETGMQTMGTALTMPSTYETSAENYIGKMEFDKETGKVLVAGELYKSVESEINDKIAQAKKAHETLTMKENLTEEEQATLEDAKARLGYESKSNLMSYSEILESYEPKTAFESIRHGIGSNVAEILAENVGGKLFAKGMNKVAPIKHAINKFDNTRLGGIWNKSTEAFKNATGTGDMISNVPAEIFEEYFVTPMHAVNDWSTDPMTEMWDLNAAADVAVQTAVMGIAMRSAGFAMTAKQRITNPELFANRKKMQEEFTKLSKSTDDKEINEIINLADSKTANGVARQRTKIEALRAKNKKDEADYLEKKMFSNLAMKAFQTGTIDNFEDALDSVTRNQYASEETKLNAQVAKQKISKLKDAAELHSKKPNFHKLMNFELSILDSKEALGEIEKDKNKIFDRVTEDIDTFQKENGIDVPYEVDSLFEQQDASTEEGKAYNSFLNKLLSSDIESIEKLSILDASNKNAQYNIDTARKAINNYSSRKYQKKLKAKADFAQKFSAEYRNELAPKFDNLPTDKKQEYLERARAIKEKAGSRFHRMGVDPYKKTAQKLFEKDNANKVVTVEQIDNIVNKIPSKGLTKEEIEEQTNRYKAYARLSQLKDVANRATAANNKYKKDDNTPDAPEPTPEGEAIGNGVNKAMEGVGTIKTTTVTNDSLDDDFDELPRTVDDFSDEQKTQAKDVVKNLSDSIKEVNGKAPTFREMVDYLVQYRGKEEVEDAFNVFKLGWEQNNYKNTDFNKVYNDVFDPIKSSVDVAVNSALDIFNPQPTKQESQESNKKAQQEIKQKQGGKTRFDGENNPVKFTRGRKIADAEYKVAYSAVEYVEQVDSNGVVEKKTVPTTSLKTGRASEVNFFPLLDPDKYNEGDKLYIEVSDESNTDWNETLVKTGNILQDGTQETQPFSEWLAEREAENPDFRETEEFRNKVPMFFTNEDGERLAYVHDIDWYNPLNVDDPTLDDADVDPQNPTASHQKLIDEGRQNVAELRKAIMEDGLSGVTITEKKEGAFVPLPDGMPAITIEEANPQSEVAVQIGSELFSGRGVQWGEGTNKIIINPEESFEKVEKGKIVSHGHVWHLRRVGTIKKNGKTYETYRAFESLRYTDDNKWGVTNEAFETVRWLWAAQAKLDKQRPGTYRARIENNTDNSEASKYRMSDAQAQAIVDEVKAITGVDLTVAKDASDYFDNFFKTSNGNALSEYGKQLFAKGANPKSFRQNTNLGRFGNNKNMAVVTEDGTVKDTGKPYEKYLLTQLKTSVQSFNVGTKENPVYATSVQPVIRFKPDMEIERTMKDDIDEEVKEKIEESGLDDDASKKLMEEALQNLSEMGMSLDDDLDLEDLLPGTLDTLEPLENVSNVTPGLTIAQESQVVDFLFNNLLVAIDNKYDGKVDKSRLNEELKDAYNDVVGEKRDKALKMIASLKNLYESDTEKNAKLLPVINSYEKLLNKFDTVEQNWDTIKDKAVEKATKYTEIKEVAEDNEDDSDDPSQRVKDYNKSSIEESAKEKTSYRLRRFMAGIEELTPEGNTKTGFLGVPTYIGFNDVYNSIAQFYGIGTDVEGTYDAMKKKLEEMANTHTWVRDLIKKLDEADGRIKNEFVYNYTKHALSMKFAMYSVDENGTILQVYDTNANEITRVIRDTWKNNLKTTNLIDKTKELYSVDKVYAKTLLDRINKWGDDFHEQKDADLRNLLSEFGIDLADEAWGEIKDGNFYNGRTVKYIDQFYTEAGIFKQIRNYLEYITDDSIKNTEFEENEKNHPFSEMQNILKELSKLQSMYTTQSMTMTFRDGTKQISGQVPPKYVTDRVAQLRREGMNKDKDSRKTINRLKSKSFSSNSMILRLLENNKDFARKFKLHHVGITSLKQLGTSRNSYSSITDLNSVDHDAVKLTGFQDTKQGSLAKGNEPFNLRIANMFLPTMSDKSQMLFMQTGVYDFMNDASKAFEVQGDNIKFKADLRDVLYNQLILPEIKRILKFHKEVGSTNVKGYDQAAQMFNLFPELNNVTDENGERLIFEMKHSKDITLEDIEKNYKDKLVDVVEDFMHEEATKKKEVWDSFVEKDSSGKINKIKLFDKTYLNKATGTLNEKYNFGVYDYILNSTLANSEAFMVLAGDPAMYAKDGDFKNENGEIVPASEQSNDFFKAMSKKTGVNIGKRLALLIAPGNKIANSVGDKYLQLFLEDANEISDNSQYLIKLNYGAEAITPEVEKLFEEHDGTEDFARKLAIRKALGKQFPKIAPYLEIESTDAQEYTTATEHVNVMYRSGKLSEEDYNIINSKIQAQKKYEQQGELIPEESLLTKEELNLVLQPIKPVYTGQVIDNTHDTNKDLMRTTYIKSSSFPLLPQVTAGTKLNNLRKRMEELEENTPGISGVRASYQTANKVGAVKNPIDPLADLSAEDMKLSSLTLDRDNFRIQQDVPFKSDKSGTDEVSMGTQMFKILFGDGVLNEEDFQLNGQPMSGRELYEEFKKNWANLIRIKKEELYDELGYDENGKSTDPKKTAEKLQKLLKSEATKRGYPIQNIKGLELERKEVVDDRGDVIKEYYEFRVPLWLATESNRYESLLNSIVTKRIFQHKLPGNAYVVGSEQGFAFEELNEDGTIPGIDNSRVLYLRDNSGKMIFNGKSLNATYKKDGKLHKAQVFVPSKFKSKGKLVDLFEDFDRRTGQGKYIEKAENGALVIKPGMIDSDLLSTFTFRTPTSEHLSGSTVEVAGFLPPEVGDLMIVPKNFTTQKGLDFDVDKETAYALHHAVNYKTGKIEVLTEKHKRRRLAGLKKALEETKNETKELEVLFSKKFDTSGEQRDVNLGLTNELIDFLKSDLNSIEEKIKRVSRDFDKKLAENNFIKIHQAVFSNPSDNIQNKINKVLSMKFASEQADMIEGLNDQSKGGQFSILSEEYQKEKMGLGAAGKLAIGVYSNYLTFHGLSQQIDRPITMLGADGERRGIRIGNQSSDGVIGEIMTLDGGRSIADAFAEKQNTATDNEKEQILGRVNVNGTTINVDSLLTLLGFDKDENGNSVPYLLLSQPIIKEFVKRVNDSRGITADFVKDLEETVVGELIEEYGNNEYSWDPELMSLVENSTGEEVDFSDMLDGNKLLSNITNATDKVQLGALAKFLELQKYAKNLSKVQSVLNTKSLGKSIVEASEKHSLLETFDENDMFANVDGLIGDFVDTGTGKTVGNDYVKVGENKYVRPTTPQGQIVVNGLSLGNSIWEQYFPYSDPYFKEIFREVMKITDVKGDSVYKKVEIAEEVAQEAKKYLYSMTALGIFTDKASIERQNLFMDIEEDGHKSLANYLSTLKSTDKANAKGVKSVKENRLINKFTYELETNGSPSLIKFNNTSSDNFDEEYLYNALPELITNNQPLPDKNGQPYNTRLLAQELIMYAYLEGGVQEAIQFIKHVPVEYLESVVHVSKKGVKTTAKEKLQRLNPLKDPEVFQHVFGVKGLKKGDVHTHTFVKQYIQHNPDKARQFDKKTRNKLFKNWSKDGQKFFLQSEEQPKFIAIKNSTKSKKKQDKFSLYENVGNNNFRKIDVLGTHGMNEYQFKVEDAKTIISHANPSNTPGEKERNFGGKSTRTTGMPFGITENTTIPGFFQAILEDKRPENDHLRKMAEYLAPMVKDSTKLKIVPNWKAQGSYNRGEDVITLDQGTIMESPEKAAKVFFHEFLHSISSKELRDYFENDGVTVKRGVTLPDHVSKLFIVFNKYRKSVDQSKLQKFNKKTASKEDIEIFYPASSIFEFVTMAMTEPATQDKLKAIPYGETNKSMWDKFKETFSKLIQALHPNSKGDTLMDAAIASILEYNEETSGERKAQRMADPDRQSQADKDASSLPDPDSQNNGNFGDGPTGDPSNDVPDGNSIDLLPDCL